MFTCVFFCVEARLLELSLIFVSRNLEVCRPPATNLPQSKEMKITAKTFQQHQLRFQKKKEVIVSLLLTNTLFLRRYFLLFCLVYSTKLKNFKKEVGQEKVRCRYLLPQRKSLSKLLQKFSCCFFSFSNVADVSVAFSPELVSFIYVNGQLENFEIMIEEVSRERFWSGTSTATKTFKSDATNVFTCPSLHKASGLFHWLVWTLPEIGAPCAVFS